jgi:S-adenosylmethionine:tRNA ribosyltransferase-isomerase
MSNKLDHSQLEDTSLRIEDFEYDLPPELIAQAPLPVRHSSRLMVIDRHGDKVEHRQFEDLSQILHPSDLLVVNNTSVIPARLLAHRQSSGQIRLLLIKPHNHTGVFEALVSPIKRLKPGEKLTVKTELGSVHHITVVDIIIGPDGHKRLLVDLGQGDSVYSLLKEVGHAPLPPYIQRKDASHRKADLERYQTVFASQPGAVAAPTAGLHFSEELLQSLSQRGQEICQITLHVGPGTFKPIAESLDRHTIEPELFHISASAAEMLRRALAEKRRIIATGTTSLRALETAGALHEGRAIGSVDWQETALYIKPGHHFKVASGLITNFHLSRSSLLVLVAAFAGRQRIMKAYAEAIKERYRFFSYGDATLII